MVVAFCRAFARSLDVSVGMFRFIVVRVGVSVVGSFLAAVSVLCLFFAFVF